MPRVKTNRELHAVKKAIIQKMAGPMFGGSGSSILHQVAASFYSVKTLAELDAYAEKEAKKIINKVKKRRTKSC
jgi:hypothetical protein